MHTQSHIRRSAVTFALLAAALLLASLSSRASAQSCDWELVAAGEPLPRVDPGVVYDSDRDVTLLFGGSINSQYLPDTWELVGSIWYLADAGGGGAPAARQQHAMAYDSQRGVTVMFGGQNAPNGFLNDTWEWDGDHWTLADSGTGTAPSPRWSPGVAYDSSRGVTVLFGGYKSGYRSDTWEWNGSEWRDVTPSNGPSPSPRDNLGMAYDTARGVTVLFGGYDGARRDDTWEWDGNEWRLVHAGGQGAPGGRNGHALTYNSATDQTILFGGWNGSYFYPETWAWNGRTWLQRTSDGALGRSNPGFAFDSTRRRVIMCGGYGGSYDETTWSLACTAYLQIEDPAADITRRQDESIDIAWVDDGEYGTQIRLYFDPDTGPEPWDEGGVRNEIRIPEDIFASGPDQLPAYDISDLSPGMYSIWGTSDNGSDPLTYSRAPGLLTVTTYSYDTEPDPDYQRLDLGLADEIVTVLNNDNATHLVLVTHGMNSVQDGDYTDHSWIVHIADDVATHIYAHDDERWDVAYLNWSAFASRHGGQKKRAAIAVLNARNIGRTILPYIDSYEHVEIIAHSAGAWVGDGASIEHPSGMTMNLVMLDPGVALGLESVLGAHADHVFCAYDSGGEDADYTPGAPLPHAFNVDMTCRREGDWLNRYPPYDGSAHGAPWAWYRMSTTWADYDFMDDDTYSYNEQPAPLGFKMSKAYTPLDDSDFDMSHYPDDGRLYKLTCDDGLWSGCDVETTVFVEYEEHFDLSALAYAVGTDGQVEVTPNSAEITTGTSLGWIGFDVPFDRACSAVLFDLEFTSSDPNAEGYGAMYWNGVQVTAEDERFADEYALPTSGCELDNTLAPGTRTVSFRLDNNGGPTSSLQISNLRYGIRLDADIDGDCTLTEDDLCAWVAEPTDLDGNGLIDAEDQEILARALGVSNDDSDGDGIPDVCEECLPDLNDDGVVNTQDFLIYLNAWASEDPIADWNEDGNVDTLDFLAYLNDWATGCP